MKTILSLPTVRAPLREDAGKLVLRVALAVLMLFHGLAKLRGGIASIEGMLSQAGLPPALGYLVYVGEVLAPVLILLGLRTRLAALVVTANMVVAVLLVHTGDLFMLGRTGGWALELQAFYGSAAIAVALLGPGRFSLEAAAVSSRERRRPA